MLSNLFQYPVAYKQVLKYDNEIDPFRLYCTGKLNGKEIENKQVVVNGFDGCRIDFDGYYCDFEINYNRQHTELFVKVRINKEKEKKFKVGLENGKLIHEEPFIHYMMKDGNRVGFVSLRLK